MSKILFFLGLRKNRFTPEIMISLWGSGVIGQIELRNWISYESRGFRKSRREDVDKALEQIGDNPSEFFVPSEENDEDFE